MEPARLLEALEGRFAVVHERWRCRVVEPCSKPLGRVPRSIEVDLPHAVIDDWCPCDEQALQLMHDLGARTTLAVLRLMTSSYQVVQLQACAGQPGNPNRCGNFDVHGGAAIDLHRTAPPSLLVGGAAADRPPRRPPSKGRPTYRCGATPRVRGGSCRRPPGS